MDKELQAYNQLQLNLAVPYDARQLEARLKPPQPIVIEKVVAPTHHQGDSKGGVMVASHLQLGVLSKDRLAAAQFLAQRDLKQKKYASEVQQRLSQMGSETSRSQQTPTPPPEAASKAMSRVGSSPTAARVLRSPEKPRARSKTMKSAKSEVKKQPMNYKSTGSPSHSPLPEHVRAQQDGASMSRGGVATEPARSDLTRVPIAASKLSALREHINTIESELQRLSSSMASGKPSARKEEALQRLAESHRGAIQTLQAFASDIPNHKYSDSDATYSELAEMMAKLSQLCTQLELSGASTTPGQPVMTSIYNAAKEELVSSDKLASATKPLKKGVCKKVKVTSRTPSERLYPRVKSASVKKISSAVSAKRSPYAPRQPPPVVSPYLTKPPAADMTGAAAEVALARQLESRKCTVHFQAQERQVDAGERLSSNNGSGRRETGDADEVMPQPEDFVQHLRDARKRIVGDEGALRQGQHEVDEDPKTARYWIEEARKSIQHRQQASEGTVTAAERLESSCMVSSTVPHASSRHQQQSCQHNTWEAPEEHTITSRKSSGNMLNAGITRIYEGKISANSEVLAEMIMSDLMEDTAREMAALEDGPSSEESSTLYGEENGILDQLLARLDSMQAEQDEMRRRWTEMTLYVSSASPEPSELGTLEAAGVPIDRGHGDASSISSSTISAVNGFVAARDYVDGEDGRSVVFTQTGRAAMAADEPSQALIRGDGERRRVRGATAHATHRSRDGAHHTATPPLPLTVPRSRLAAIAENLQEFKRHLQCINQATTVDFDPRQFTEECAEELKEACVDAVASEFNKATNEIVDMLYKDEFLAPGGEAKPERQ